MTNATYQGVQDAGSSTTDYNATDFHVQVALAKMRTATRGKIVKAPYDKNGNPITPGAVTPIGYVDVQPLVNQMNGDGTPTPHGTVYRLSYFRYQGTNGAHISDPVLGDIGVIIVSDRDTSVVQSTNAAANPGSYRRFDLSDGIYFGCPQDATAPQQYHVWKPTGWTHQDRVGNQVVTTATGMTVQDKQKNNIVMSPAGTVVTDVHKNVITMVQNGIKLLTKSGNIINLLTMATGVTGLGSILPANFTGIASIAGNVLNLTNIAGQIFPGSAIIPQTLAAVGSVANDVMTISNIVNGTINPGLAITQGAFGNVVQQLTGSTGGVGTYLLDTVAQSVPALTAIAGGINAVANVVSQISGTPNGVGSYMLDTDVGNVASAVIGGTHGLLSLPSVVGGAFAVGNMLMSSGINAATAITAFTSGAGEAGTTGIVSPSQTATNQSMSAGTGSINFHDASGNSIVGTPGGLVIIGVGTGVTINGARITPAGEIIDALGILLGVHLHIGVTPGSGDSGPPIG